MSGLNLDDYFMNEALKQARLALEEGEVPIGAVIVSGNQLLAKGYNQTERLNDVTAHAEILAMTAATHNIGSKYLRDCTLYVTVEPCPMCAAALGWAQLGRLVYAAPDVKRGYTLFSPNLLHPKTEVISGIHSEACSRLIVDFFRSKRK